MTKGKIVSILCVIMLAISGVLVWVFNPFGGGGEPLLKEVFSAASAVMAELDEKIVNSAHLNNQGNISALASSKLDDFDDEYKYEDYFLATRAVGAMVNMVNILSNQVTIDNGYEVDFTYDTIYTTELSFMGKWYLKCKQIKNGVHVKVDLNTELADIIIKYDSSSKKITNVILSSSFVGTLGFDVIHYDVNANQVNAIHVYYNQSPTTIEENNAIYNRFNSGELTLSELLDYNITVCTLVSAKVSNNIDDIEVLSCSYEDDGEGTMSEDDVTAIYNKVYANTKDIEIRTEKMSVDNEIPLDEIGKAYIRSMNMGEMDKAKYDGKVYFKKKYISYQQMLRNLTAVKESIDNDQYTADQKAVIDTALEYLNTAGEKEFLGWFNTIDESCSISMNYDLSVDFSSGSMKFIEEISIYDNYVVAHVTYKLLDGEFLEVVNE